MRTHSDTERRHLEEEKVGLVLMAEREVGFGMALYALRCLGLSEGEARMIIDPGRAPRAGRAVVEAEPSSGRRSCGPTARRRRSREPAPVHDRTVTIADSLASGRTRHPAPVRGEESDDGAAADGASGELMVCGARRPPPAEGDAALSDPARRPRGGDGRAEDPESLPWLVTEDGDVPQPALDRRPRPPDGGAPGPPAPAAAVPLS